LTKHIEEFTTYSLQDLVNIENIDKKITENRSIYIEQQSDQESSMEATLGRHQARSGGQLWFDAAIYDKNRLEEIPTFDKICIAGEPYIALRSSPHQASWILHKDEILRINTTCNFLTMTWDKSWKNQGFVREYMSSYSIYSNPFHTRIPVNCMLNKVIPAGKLEIFKIRHYQRSKVSKWSLMKWQYILTHVLYAIMQFNQSIHIIIYLFFYRHNFSGASPMAPQSIGLRKR
jgi:hypothetical protein